MRCPFWRENEETGKVNIDTIRLNQRDTELELCNCEGKINAV